MRKLISCATLRGLIGSLIAVSCVSCAAIDTGISKRNLDVQTKMSHTIFKEPAQSSGQKYVYVEIDNTTGYPEFDISDETRAALASLGYLITTDPDKATYTLQAQVLHLQRTTPESFARAHYGGFGESIAGAAIGAMIGSGAGRNGAYYGAGAGLLAFGLGTVVGNALVKDVVYVVVTDVRLGERLSGKTSRQISANARSGIGGSTNQIYEDATNRLYHTTRIVSSANKVNLKIEQATPALRAGLVHSLVGLL